MIDISKPRKPFDWAEYERTGLAATADGRKVRDLHRLSEPIAGGSVFIGVVVDHNGHTWVTSWSANGRFLDFESPTDLINVPEQETVELVKVRRSSTGEVEWKMDDNGWEPTSILRRVTLTIPPVGEGLEP